MAKVIRKRTEHERQRSTKLRQLNRRVSRASKRPTLFSEVEMKAFRLMGVFVDAEVRL